MKRIALIIATNSKGQLLLGKRNDSGKWTVPGGHLNEGEDPWDGAVRELKEETGLTPDDDILDKVDERSLGQAQFYTFLCSVTGKPTGKNDPDEECSEWRWFDVKDGLPKEVQGNLAGPRDESKNIIVDHFGLEKMLKVPGFPKLGIEDRRETPFIDTPQQTKLKGLQISWNLRQQFPDQPKSDMDEYGKETIENAQGAVVNGLPEVNTSFVHTNPSVLQFHPKLPVGPKSDVATKTHEDFHQMMDKIQAKHGKAARFNLAQNLWNSVPYKHSPYHQEFATYASGFMRNEYQKPEENIAMLHNYLNDPAEREKYHNLN
jgi:ADP-ribose pyrophosphatase YjhB (NUDIX family)